MNSATTVNTILICEDEDSLRELIRVSLGPGYRLVEAGGYEDAVALARAHRPDLVVLDLMLSGRSGFDLLREFRAEEATAETPVLVLSALSHVEDDTLRAGADRFLAKPFDPERLRALAGEMLDGP